MFAEDEKIIRSYLVGDFEQKFFDACLDNLTNIGNPLRLNNFAYAMRELIRNVLGRLAPTDEVIASPWYEQNEVVDGPTRAQRMKYAIQGWLSDETMQNELHVDIAKTLKELKDSVNDLSKYTHVESNTFDVKAEEIDDMSNNVFENVAQFFTIIQKTRKAVLDAVMDYVDEDMVQQFYQTINPDIDLLASHHEIENYWVKHIEKEDDRDGCVHVLVRGDVEVRLQYGSDGDVRRGDGYEMYENFPFTAELDVSYKNQYGDIRILEDGHYTFDVDSFYE